MTSYRGAYPLDQSEPRWLGPDSKTPPKPGWRCRTCGDKISRTQYYADVNSECGQCLESRKLQSLAYNRGPQVPEQPTRVLPDVSRQLQRRR